MTTDELIKALRCCQSNEIEDPCAECPADYIDAPNCMETVMREAADRLEEMEERIAVMAADMDNAWGNNYN